MKVATEQLVLDDQFIAQLATAVNKQYRWSLERVTTLVVLLVNVIGLVWAAANLSNAVDANSKTIARNTAAIEQVVKLVGDLEARMRVVEDRTRPRSGSGG
jgi:Ser-tRNA(Ala) deacylase AlaX